MSDGAETVWGKFVGSQSTLKAIYVLGIPGFLCIVLVLVQLLRFDAEVRETNDLMKLHVITSEQIQNQNGKLMMFLQQICVNTSTDTTERRNCFQ